MSAAEREGRVLLTTDTVGGAFVFASSLAKGLRRRGWSVILVTLGPAPRPDQIVDLKRAGIGVEVTDLALEWMEPAGADLPRAAAVLGALERRLAPDLVHLNGFREATLGWRVPVLVTAHSCVRSWWLAVKGEEPPSEWRAYVDNVRAGLAAARAWTAPTRAFATTIERLYQPADLGIPIANGIEPLLPGNARRPVVLAAGRLWDEAKNVKTLAAVAGRLDWPIRLAGPCSSPGEASRPGGASGLIFLGVLVRDDLLAELTTAELFVAPALYEPFGLAVLEAAASGCALVLANIPSFAELWGGAALFFDPRDPEALLAALRRASWDADLRASLRAAATERARAYSLDRTVDAYAGLYAAIAAGQAPLARPAQPAGALVPA